MPDAATLSDPSIRTILATRYGLKAVEIDFLPVGNDPDSRVYRFEAVDGARYLLKLRAERGFRIASLAVPGFLRRCGISSVLAPVNTLDGGYFVAADGFALCVYPFIDAPTVADAGLVLEGWRTLGATLRLVHETVLPSHLREVVPNETFVPSRRDVLDRLEWAARRRAKDPVREDLAAFWRSRSGQISALVELTDAKGEQWRQRQLHKTLCHSDLHGWNLLAENAERLWIVDWDETVLAPRERDLMFVIGGIGYGLVKPAETEAFMSGYGDVEVDTDLLAYYRCAWAVQDIAAYAQEALVEETEQTARSRALRGFVNLFAPGNIVDIAFADIDQSPDRMPE